MAADTIPMAILVVAVLACAVLAAWLILRKLVRLVLGLALLGIAYLAAFYLLTASARVDGRSPPVVQRSFPSALAMTAFLPCMIIDRGWYAATGATVEWVVQPPRG